MRRRGRRGRCARQRLLGCRAGDDRLRDCGAFGFLRLRRGGRAGLRPKVSSVVSTTTSLTRYFQPAPRAWRTASSLTRALARMRSRLTRLTPPIRSSSKTAASSKSRVGRTAATWSARSGTTSERKPASAIILACGSSTSSAVFCASICDWACARVAPGARRAIIWITLPPAWRRRGGRDLPGATGAARKLARLTRGNEIRGAGRRRRCGRRNSRGRFFRGRWGSEL